MPYTHCGKSPPRPAATCGERHSGLETTGLVGATCFSALARLMQPVASVIGTTTSALCPPAAVSGPIRSVALMSYPTDLTSRPAAFKPAVAAAAALLAPAWLGYTTAADLACR